MLPCTGSTISAAMPCGRGSEAAADVVAIVEPRNHRIAGGAGRDARRIGHTQGGGSRARAHQEHVGVAVIGAGELDDQRPPGCGTRHAHGAHRRFGPRDDEADHLAAGHARGDSLGQVDFARRGEAEDQTARQRRGQRPLDLRDGVAEQGRSPRADPVDQAAAAVVDHVRAARLDNRQRLRAHRLEGAHRRVHAARCDAAGAFEPWRGGGGRHAVTTSRNRCPDKRVAIARAK